MFESEATARTTAEIVSGHRNTTASFFIRLRRLIAGKLSSCELSGEVEAEESCFGGIRKGKRWRGAPEKWRHSACLSGPGRFFTAIAANLRAGVLLPIIEEKVTPVSIVCTDSFKTYNALDPCAFHHMRINHSELFADRGNYINGIENLWIQAKRHLWQFNVINKDSFHWFIEERERRFN